MKRNYSLPVAFIFIGTLLLELIIYNGLNNSVIKPSGYILDKVYNNSYNYETQECSHVLIFVSNCRNVLRATDDKWFFELKKCDPNNACEYTNIQVTRQEYLNYDLGDWYPDKG